MLNQYFQKQLSEIKRKWVNGEAHCSHLLGSLEAFLEKIPDNQTINDYHDFKQKLLDALGVEEKVEKKRHKFWYATGRVSAIRNMKREKIIT